MKKVVIASIIAIALFSCQKQVDEKVNVEDFQSKQNNKGPCPEITAFTFTSFIGEYGNTKLRINLAWINKNHKPEFVATLEQIAFLRK